MVVSDINMPRMDGLTLLARLQDEATRFSTVIVSAYGDMANIRTAMNRGAFDFLTKPIDFADFETTVRKTIAHVANLKDARRAPGGGGTRPRVALALFLAQSRAQPRRRRQRARARRRAARDRDPVHRYRRLHAAGRVARPQAADEPAQRLSRRHDGDRVRARRHGRQDHRRCDPRLVQRARRTARRGEKGDRLRARARCVGGSRTASNGTRAACRSA